jgi:hypothetical protein
MSKKSGQKRRKTGHRSRDSGRGRVVQRPVWESVWTRASGFAGDSAWESVWTRASAFAVDSAWESEKDGLLPSHRSIFEVLDALASTDDGLGALAVLADILDCADHVPQIESKLRALARFCADQSEAALFSGYVDPSSASSGDPSAMAGRLLRGFRDRNMEELVSAANANGNVFVARRFVGLLTVVDLLRYELVREDDQAALKDHVLGFLADEPFPARGIEELLELLGVGLEAERISNFLDNLDLALNGEDLVVLRRIGGRLPSRTPVVVALLNWCLRLEEAMNASSPSPSVRQPGTKLSSEFAAKASRAALAASETRWAPDLVGLNVPEETVQGQWLKVLSNISPPGFEHKRISAFTPEDVVSRLSPMTQEDIDRLLAAGDRMVKSQRAISKSSVFADKQDAYSQRISWLVCLSNALVGLIQPTDIFEKLDDPTFLPHLDGSVTGVIQRQILWCLVASEADDWVESEPNRSPDDQHTIDMVVELLAAARENPLSTELLPLLGKTFLDREIAGDELRSVVAWTELLAGLRGVAPLEFPSGRSITDFPEDEGVWLGHFLWWLQARGWKPKKERPPTEDLGPAPAAVVREEEAVSTSQQSDQTEEVLELDAPTHIVFVGGDEGQAKRDAQINTDISNRYSDLVTVEWVHTDWTAQWQPDAKRVSDALGKTADALVLMPLVRTGMGAYLRKAAGEQGVPWIACTGRGVATITRSLDEAIQVVCRERLT